MACWNIFDLIQYKIILLANLTNHYLLWSWFGYFHIEESILHTQTSALLSQNQGQWSENGFYDLSSSCWHTCQFRLHILIRRQREYAVHHAISALPWLLPVLDNATLSLSWKGVILDRRNRCRRQQTCKNVSPLFSGYVIPHKKRKKPPLFCACQKHKCFEAFTTRAGPDSSTHQAFSVCCLSLHLNDVC